MAGAAATDPNYYLNLYFRQNLKGIRDYVRNGMPLRLRFPVQHEDILLLETEYIDELDSYIYGDDTELRPDYKIYKIYDTNDRFWKPRKPRNCLTVQFLLDCGVHFPEDWYSYFSMKQSVIDEPRVTELLLRSGLDFYNRSTHTTENIPEDLIPDENFSFYDANIYVIIDYAVLLGDLKNMFEEILYAFVDNYSLVFWKRYNEHFTGMKKIKAIVEVYDQFETRSYVDTLKDFGYSVGVYNWRYGYTPSIEVDIVKLLIENDFS